MNITKKDLSRIWRKFKNQENGPQEYWSYLSDNFKAQFVSADWKDTDELSEQFSKVLRKIGFIVIKDPLFDGSSSYGFVIIKNTDLLTKTDNFNELCTSYAFTLHASYKNIVKVFGKPNGHVSDDRKVSCEWLLKTLTNNQILIYDYKQGIPYLGPERGKRPQQITEWSVGSNKKSEALSLLDTVLTSKIGYKNFEIVDH